MARATPQLGWSGAFGERVSGPEAAGIPTDSERGFPLLQMTREHCTLGDLVVDDGTRERLERLVSETRQSRRLRSHGLAPKQKILLCGPPGTGKTMSARALSNTLGRPLVHVFFDAVISSFLGQTSANLRKIFDFVENGQYVVLFDEFDVVGKKRDDEQELGEIKRVVNNFMQMVDAYYGPSVLVAATNHEHLLDVALWRRFDEIVVYGLPDRRAREALFKKYLGTLGCARGAGTAGLARSTDGHSAADIAQICENALRRSVIRGDSAVTREDLRWSLGEQERRRELVGDARNGRRP